MSASPSFGWPSDALLLQMGGVRNETTGRIDPPPEVIKSDPALCSHGVLDELAGIPWGFEDCVTCGKRFPMRTDEPDDYEPEEPDYDW